jgi:PatG Domain
MEQSVIEVQEQAGIAARGNSPATTSSAGPAATAVSPQACSTCGAGGGGTAAPPSWVYAMGRIEPRFPSISVEKEFAQATSRDKTAGLTDRQALHAVLSKPENRYLVRLLCWVMTIEGLETYIVVPRDPADFSLLVETLRPTPQPWDLDVVIGSRGPVAPSGMCNGLMVPIVVFDQIYSFDRDALIKSIPKPDKSSAKEFAPAAEELFDRILQMTDNAGATDSNRTLNYLAVRFPAIYHKTAEYFGKDYSLTAVNVQGSSLSGTRNILEAIFTYTNRSTDVADKWFVRVDATDEFLFLVTKLSPYYDR